MFAWSQMSNQKKRRKFTAISVYHGLRMWNCMTCPIKYYFRGVLLQIIGDLFLFLPKLGNDWGQISELCLFSQNFPFGLMSFGSSRNSDWSLNFDSEFYENYFHIVKVQWEISVQTTFKQNSVIELCCIATNCNCERFWEFHSSNSFYDLKKLLRIENFWKEVQPSMDSYTIDKRIVKWEMVGKNPKHILLVHADTLQPMSLYNIGYLYRSLPLCVFFIYSDGTSYAESPHYIPLMVPGLLPMSRGRDHL